MVQVKQENNERVLNRSFEDVSTKNMPNHWTIYKHNDEVGNIEISQDVSDFGSKS